MLFDLIRALPAALFVGLLPGWFWARLLIAPGDRAETIAYSAALSLAMVPALALALSGLLGVGITPLVAVGSALAVFLAGLALHLRFGSAKGEGGPVVPAPVPPGLPVLVPVVVALGLVLGSDLADLGSFRLAGECWGWPVAPCLLSGEAQGFLLPVALLLLAAGVAYALFSRRSSSRRGPEKRDGEPGGRQSPPAAAVARGLALPAVLVLALLRGYAGPVLHDWPYVRGVDHYSHTVMANLVTGGEDVGSYLIYPAGLHAMTAMVSRLSGLDPLEIFPVLGPASLLLPALSLYVLGLRLWGWGHGIAASALSLLLGGTYFFYNDAMYPNLIASQFLMVLAVAALVRLYRSASPRTAVLLAVPGSAVVLYHQVSSLYLAALLALVGLLFLPPLLLREREKGLTLLGSFALLGVLSVAYAWNTYDLPGIFGGLLGASGGGETGTAMGMAVGTQVPYGIGLLVGAVVSQPVAWLGLLGALFLAGGLLAGRGGGPQGLAHLTVLLWALILFLGSRTAQTGFPQRFGRDLGVPLALLAAFALVMVLRALRRPVRRPSRHASGSRARGAAGTTTATVVAASLALVFAGSLVGLRGAQAFGQAAGPSPFLMMTPEIAEAGEWLEGHNGGGNIMVGPQGTSIPSRMMLAMGDYSALQSFEARDIRNPRDLPPTGPEPLKDVLRVVKRPQGGRADRLIERHNVRYIVLYKYTRLEGPTADYWPLFKRYPDLYETAFENDHVLIAAPREGREGREPRGGREPRRAR